MFARSHLLHVQPTPSLCAFHTGHEKRPEHSGLSRFRPAQTKPGPTVQQGESHFPNATGERYFLSKEKEPQGCRPALHARRQSPNPSFSRLLVFWIFDGSDAQGVAAFIGHAAFNAHFLGPIAERRRAGHAEGGNVQRLDGRFNIPEEWRQVE